MAKLSADEKAALKRLQEKADAPDEPPISRSVNATVDFSNPKSIEAAIKHGFLTAAEAEEIKEEEKDNKKKGDATPRRRGYFKDDDDGD